MMSNKFGGERLESKNELSRNNLLEHLARYDLVVGSKQQNVLDVGCGAGHGSHTLSAKFKKAYGVDISEKAIEYAKQNWAAENVEFTIGSGLKLPFENEYFETVVSFEVFEHIADWKNFLVELKRVLKKDGLLYISTPNKDVYSPGTIKPVNPHHFFEMTISEFKNALSEFFIIEKFYGQRTPVYNDHWIWKIVNPILFGLKGVISYKFNNKIKLTIINLIKPELTRSDIVFYEDSENLKKSRFMIAVCKVK